jgi:hypothetical protein
VGRIQEEYESRAEVEGRAGGGFNDPRLGGGGEGNHRHPFRAGIVHRSGALAGKGGQQNRSPSHAKALFTTNHTLAGRSASLRMYQGNQFSP